MTLFAVKGGDAGVRPGEKIQPLTPEGGIDLLQQLRICAKQRFAGYWIGYGGRGHKGLSLFIICPGGEAQYRPANCDSGCRSRMSGSLSRSTTRSFGSALAG